MATLDKTKCFKTEKTATKDCIALYNFVQNLYLKESISKELSHKNIQKNTVEIIRGGRHTSNGLLISNNGYILTCYHCVEFNISQKKVKLSNGKIYPIEKLVLISRTRDIAIIKINLPGNSEAIKIRINRETFLQDPNRSSVLLLSRRDGSLKATGGYLHAKRREVLVRNRNKATRVKDSITLQLEAHRGDSGGPIVDSNASLVGLIASGTPKKCKSSCFGILSAMSIIGYYLNKRECRQFAN